MSKNSGGTHLPPERKGGARLAAAPTGREFPSRVPIFRRIVSLDENMEHTPPMLSSTHNQRVLDLASQKGLLRASDLDAISAPRVVLTRLTAAGLLEKVGRGLYRLPDVQIPFFMIKQSNDMISLIDGHDQRL